MTAANEPADGYDRSAHLAEAEGALLRADEVVAGYVPEVDILTGCDLYCRDGEAVGLIGPNGAGKSTLDNAIFGLVKVRKGKVSPHGANITEARADVHARMVVR